MSVTQQTTEAGWTLGDNISAPDSDGFYFFDPNNRRDLPALHLIQFWDGMAMSMNMVVRGESAELPQRPNVDLYGRFVGGYQGRWFRVQKTTGEQQVDPGA